ncbi:major facilitator superfamily domain-containing protein [Aspergillus ambiguus]|uniref:putative MFS transporter n=1 Tax=Aspergillus ambiguus TaxID=176160 RepID=UPI003CCD16F0
MDVEDPQARPVYSAFSKQAKYFIVFMVTLASFFSPLSGQIYYPVMPTLVHNYHLTTALINLSITTYMILQGLAPSFMGTFADSGGRRPAYLLAFTIYTAANIGLALQNSYAALMVLRCLQSAGSSGTIAFGYGVIADITTPALGPIIGGLLAEFLGWRSVFWFLAIISGSYLVLYALTMPETARSVVGNGHVPPTQGWRMSVVQYCRRRRRRRHARRSSHDVPAVAATPADARSKLAFPNPLRAFSIVLEPDALILISFVGLVMFANIALMTSTPNLFTRLYGLNTLEIGLCFLACIGAILNGKLLDRSYRRTVQRLGLPTDRKRGDDLRHFFPVVAVGLVAFVPYGWTLDRQAPLAVPLVLQFFVGFSFVAANSTLSTLLVDLFPDRPATASAASNLVRCWLGAVGAAVIDSMLWAMGAGLCFTFWGLVLCLEVGMRWREKRAVRLEKQRQQQQQEDQRYVIATRNCT